MAAKRYELTNTQWERTNDMIPKARAVVARPRMTE